MKLYYAPGSCAVACWISRSWAGADFEVSKANYASEEFRRVNPLATVPALDIGTAGALTQADAILSYIADRYPAARLGPVDIEPGRFEFSETMSFLSSDFHPAFWPFFGPARFTTDTSDKALEKVREASRARIDRVMVHLDNLIGDTAHVYRNRRSVADAYAYIMVRWTAKHSRPWSDYPNISRFMHRMGADETAQEAVRLSVR